MKKLIIALLCLCSLFAFASCDAGMQTPPNEEDSINIPATLHGYWELYNEEDMATGNILEITKDSFKIGTKTTDGKFNAHTDIIQLYKESDWVGKNTLISNSSIDISIANGSRYLFAIEDAASGIESSYFKEVDSNTSSWITYGVKEITL